MTVAHTAQTVVPMTFSKEQRVRPFRFPLQQVLDYREQLEDEARLAVAKAQQAYVKQVEFTEALRATLDAHARALYDREEPLTASEIWLWQQYKDRLRQDMIRAEQHTLELAQALNRARREAVNRSRDRQVLDKLKANQKLRHDEAERLREQSEIDEMATIRYKGSTLQTG